MSDYVHLYGLKWICHSTLLCFYKCERTPIVGEPTDGNHYGPARSFLGSTSSHDNGMADLLTDENGVPLVYDPRDVLEGGNMVLWDDARVRNYEITY